MIVVVPITRMLFQWKFAEEKSLKCYWYKLHSDYAIRWTSWCDHYNEQGDDVNNHTSNPKE
jgi:hypothetical protein